MIITFQVGSELISAQVDEERTLSMRSKLTNNEFIPFTEMVGRSGQSGMEAELTQTIIRSLPTVEDVEFYVRTEFLRNHDLMRFGIRHIKTQW